MKNKIAKAVISSIMGVEPKDINAMPMLDMGYILVEYPIEGKYVGYKVKFEKGKIVWGVLNGRWRDHERDSVISYRIIQDELLISEKFNDGSLINNTFTLKDL